MRTIKMNPEMSDHSRSQRQRSFLRSLSQSSRDEECSKSVTSLSVDTKKKSWRSYPLRRVFGQSLPKSKSSPALVGSFTCKSNGYRLPSCLKKTSSNACSTGACQDEDGDTSSTCSSMSSRDNSTVTPNMDAVTTPAPVVPKKSLQNRKVIFGKICVRYYDITMGDNPSCSVGIPIQLDWVYHEHMTVQVSIEQYERDHLRLDIEKKARKPARTMEEMLLASFQRYNLLIEAGFSKRQIGKKADELKALRRRQIELSKEQPKVKAPSIERK